MLTPSANLRLFAMTPLILDEDYSAPCTSSQRKPNMMQKYAMLAGNSLYLADPAWQGLLWPATSPAVYSRHGLGDIDGPFSI